MPQPLPHINRKGKDGILRFIPTARLIFKRMTFADKPDDNHLIFRGMTPADKPNDEHVIFQGMISPNKPDGKQWTCATCEERFSGLGGASCNGCDKPVCLKCLTKFKEAQIEHLAELRVESSMVQSRRKPPYADSGSDEEGDYLELRDRSKTETREYVERKFGAKTNGVYLYCKKCDEKHANLLEIYV